MYERRELYDNSPLVLVTAEVRYPYSPRLRQMDTIDRIQVALENLLPIRRVEQRFSLQMTLGQATASIPETTEVYRFLNRTSTWSAVVSPEAFTVETTRFEDFPKFLEVLLTVARAVAGGTRIPAIERVGLRFINEIRAPETVQSASDWAGWVDPSLLPALSVKAGPLKASQGVAVYDLGESAQLQFQYAAVEGSGVVGNETLKRHSTPPPGPLFVLDFDSFWLASTPEEAEVFSIELLSEKLHRLHKPTGEVFQASITDRARRLFRKASD